MLQNTLKILGIYFLKLFEIEMLLGTKPTTLLQLYFSKFMLFLKVFSKMNLGSILIIILKSTLNDTFKISLEEEL